MCKPHKNGQCWKVKIHINEAQQKKGNTPSQKFEMWPWRWQLADTNTM